MLRISQLILIIALVGCDQSPTATGQTSGRFRSGKTESTSAVARSLVLIVDVSASMSQPVEDGDGTRLDAAKTALRNVLDDAPNDGTLEYALVTFGEHNGCSIAVPVDFTTNPQLVTSYASGLKPQGQTPLSDALKRAERLALNNALSDDILLVLLSDGEESCDGDPIAVANAIKNRGQVRLISVNTIGIGLEDGSSAQQQIRDIAQSGGGQHYSTSGSADDLTKVLSQATEVASADCPPGGHIEPSGPTNLTNHPSDDWSPVWSPDSQHIAFTSRRDGNTEIYVMDANGDNQTRLTNNPANDWSPVWSPDSQRIAFISDREGPFKIYVMDANGDNLTTFVTSTSNNVWYPAWSPDGKYISFVRSSRRDSYTGNLYIWEEGRSWDRIDDLYNHSPVWSPNGQYIAFVDICNIEIRDAFSNNQLILFEPSASNCKGPFSTDSPVWSANGRRLAFHHYGPDSNADIYVVDADGDNLTRLTSHQADDEFPSWSLYNRIAFHSDREGHRDIYMMDADGGNLIRLTSHRADDEYPKWSPDGRRVAFDSYRDGLRDIYVIEVD